MFDIKNVKTVVIKVGSSTLTHETGRLNLRRIEHLSQVLCDLANRGLRVVLVSSGAQSAGMGKLNIEHKPSDMPSRQAGYIGGYMVKRLIEQAERGMANQ